MIQDIFPSKLDNSYVNAKPEENDILLFFNREGKILLGSREKGIDFPAVSGSEGRKAVYLFSLDDTRYFLDLENEDHREPDTVRSREAASYGIGSGRILSDNKLCLSEEDGFEYCTILTRSVILAVNGVYEVIAVAAHESD